jgi:hypothetical protein
MTDERIIVYLLGDMPEEELERFEDECFAEAEWPAQIELVEENLIDDYLRGELTAKQRQLFEQNYLTTESRQERVTIAAALLRHIDERNAALQTTVPEPAPTWADRFRAFWRSQTPAFRAAGAAALITVVAIAGWYLINQVTAPRSFASVTLINSIDNRAEGTRVGRVALTPDVGALKVSLTLPQVSPPAKGYKVELESERGETVPVEVTGHDGQSVFAVIPAAKLSRGRYALRLSAIQADDSVQRIPGSYLFTVD